jgi:hypothetical protein
MRVMGVRGLTNQKLQIPNSNLQRKSTSQFSNLRRNFVSGAWNFSGAWMLELEIF